MTNGLSRHCAFAERFSRFTPEPFPHRIAPHRTALHSSGNVTSIIPAFTKRAEGGNAMHQRLNCQRMSDVRAFGETNGGGGGSELVVRTTRILITSREPVPGAAQ